MIGSVLLWACLTAGAPESQSDVDAFVRAVAQRVAEHLQEEHFAKALREIEAAEQKHALPDFVFMRALVEERRGNCRAAVPLYDEYLTTDPAYEDAEAAREGKIRCGAGPEPGVDSEPAPIQTTEPPVKPRAWYADPIGGALVIGGTVALGIGLGLFVQARADERTAERADTLTEHQRHGERARNLGIAAASVLATGGALVIAGVIRYAVIARRNRQSRVSLGPGFVVRF